MRKKLSNKTKSQAETTVNTDKVTNDNKIDKQIHHKSFKHVICDMHVSKQDEHHMCLVHTQFARNMSQRANKQLTQTYIVIMMLHYDKIQFNLNLNQFKRIKCSVYRLSC